MLTLSNANKEVIFMQQKLLSVIVVVFAILLLVGMLPVNGEEAIYDSVVRLHVLAHSDSEEDQAQKLAVRDAILTVTVPLLEDCPSREEAADRLTAAFPKIQQAAEETLRTEGSDHKVTLTLTPEVYPERRYDSVCFPSGEYLSLRVLIGDAEGQNWWCCLFPPLCLGASTVSQARAEDAFISVGFTPSQYKIITETDKPLYKARFKFLELLRR